MKWPKQLFEWLKRLLKNIENKHLAFLLKRMPVEGMHPLVFTRIAEKMVLTTVNLVILRFGPNGKLQVLLTRRPDDDICWPRMWHVPGTSFRAKDNPGNPIGAGDPIKRSLKEDFGTALAGEPIYLGDRFAPPGGRGPEINKIFLGELEGDLPKGVFFNVSDLPKNMVRNQIPWIRMAVKHYRWIKRY